MGAAFMIALVLIYILVVWEFGNFRIPALIMAPIPLTLLGIIPMHAIMGAPFTATSMIGWIALAGIIVRNSILLVDYSVREVQQGTPVAEAVIRACKTRTRPIMITALALVGGASVIFTDPIFQGMAISLASGVMVSTILTLIVIPLGCIKASKALCEVAAAGCAPGSEHIMMPDAAQVTSSKAAPAVAKPSFLLVVWSKLATLLLMLFYAVRGLFLLLGQMFKGKPKAPSPTTPPTTPSGSGGGQSPGAASSPAPEVPAAAAEPVAEVKGSASAGDSPASAEEKPDVGDVTPEQPAEPETATSNVSVEKGEVPEAEVQRSDTGSDDAKQPVAVVEDQVPESAAAPAVAKKKAVRKKAAVKKKAGSSAKTKPRPPAVKKKVAKKTAVKKAAVKKSKVATTGTTAEKSEGADQQATTPRKEGARRGIRLKINGSGGIE
jgi:hypothetical protein